MRAKRFFHLAACAVLVTGLLPILSAGAAVSDEEIALSLATLLRSARAVISDKQKHINNPDVGDKGVTADFVIGAAKKNYKKATGTDLDSIDASTLQGELLQAELAAITDVVNEAQETITQQGVGLKGFLPAVFARLVTQKFRASVGKRARLKLTAPKNFVRNRANRPDKWEHKVIEEVFKSADHKKGQHYTETTEVKGKPAYRLILPEYYKQSCLSCHGEPRGERDVTGGKKEGGKLAQLGGAISVLIFK